MALTAAPPAAASSATVEVPVSTWSTRVLDHHALSAQVLPVQLVHGVVSIAIVLEFNEPIPEREPVLLTCSMTDVVGGCRRSTDWAYEQHRRHVVAAADTRLKLWKETKSDPHASRHFRFFYHIKASRKRLRSRWVIT